MPGLQDGFHVIKSILIIHHINRIKEKTIASQMIQKHFWQYFTPIHEKNSENKPGRGISSAWCWELQTPAVPGMSVDNDGTLLGPGESAPLPPPFNGALGSSQETTWEIKKCTS